MQTDARPVSGTLEARSDRPAQMVDFTIRAVQEQSMEDCVGMVDPSAPDVVVDWRGGDLKIFTRAAADATLLVYGPDQQWHCNDDAEGLSPVVSIADAPRGRYVVWVGAFAADQPDMRATLVAGAPAPAAQPNANGQPVSGRLELHGGFESSNGAVEQAVAAGGFDPVSQMDLGKSPEEMFSCPGYVTAATPTVTLSYMQGESSTLAISASAEADLALLVRAPDGSWSCNDDFDGMNPLVGFETAQSGQYAIWVATYGVSARGSSTAATLTISETIPEQMDYGMDGDYGPPQPFSTGTYTPLQIEGRASSQLALRSDDAASATVSIAPIAGNPVRGDACSGLVEPNPTAAITLSGEGPFAFTASGEADLILTLRTPSGNWFCSDDADGLNPGIQIDEMERGTYLAWVGSYSETDGGMDIEVGVARGELVVSTPDYNNGGSDFPDYEEASYMGDELRTSSPGTVLQMGAGELTASVPAGGDLENPVEGGACQGFLSPNATATVAIGTGEFLYIRATGDDDLTMVVRSADGQWYCSDDADGSNPAVSFESETDGTVFIWVGTFAKIDSRPTVTLSLSQ